MAKVRRRSVQVSDTQPTGRADVNVTVNVRQHERRPLRFGSGNAKLSPALLTFTVACWSHLPSRQRLQVESRPRLRHHPRRPTDHLQMLCSFDGGQTRQRPSVPLAQLRVHSRLRLEARDDKTHPGFADRRSLGTFACMIPVTSSTQIISGPGWTRSPPTSGDAVLRIYQRRHRRFGSSGWARWGPATRQATSRT